MQRQRADTIASKPVAKATQASQLRFVPSEWHGVLDYGAAAALIIAPFALGLSSGALSLSVAAGVLLFGYSLVSDYKFSIARLISIRTHLGLDLAAGVALLAAPFALGFDEVARIYFLVMGLGVFGAVAATNPKPQPDRAPVAAD